MRFPLAPNFDIYVSSFDSLAHPRLKPEIKDLLNDSKTYYWRVRALDKEAPGATGARFGNLCHTGRCRHNSLAMTLRQAVLF